MKLEASQRLTVTAGSVVLREVGFDKKAWETTHAGTDQKGNDVLVGHDAKDRWIVLIVKGSKLVAYLDAKTEGAANKAAQLAVKEAKTYWSNKDPLLNYYLNSAQRIKLTRKG